MKYENDQIGKVIFVAPTKPLVNQQIAACHSVTGLSELDTAYLEGGVCPEKRQILWKTKRVFFSTPQTVVNDISGLICDPRQIVCIVLDDFFSNIGAMCFVVKIFNIFHDSLH